MNEQAKTFDDLLRAFLEICPGGEMGEDNEGQLVFYTGLQEVVGNTLAPFVDEEER